MIVVFLCGLAGFSIWRYLSINRDLAIQKVLFARLEEKNVTMLKKLDSQIVRGKQLAEEKKGLQEELKINSQKLYKLKKTLGNTRQELVKMKSIKEELSMANQKLRESQSILQARIDKLAIEKRGLLKKLSSIDELNALIEDLKKAGRIKVSSRIPVIKKAKKDADDIAGNRGYIIYRGMPTYKASPLKVSGGPTRARKGSPVDKSRVSIQVVPGD